VAGLLQRIRQRFLTGDYYLSSHAEEEMREDDLDDQTFENALLKGNRQGLTRDPRGTRYRLKSGHDGRVIQGRMPTDEEESLRIITIYALER